MLIIEVHLHNPNGFPLYSVQYSSELLANIRQAVPFDLLEKFEWKTNYAATMPKKANIILISFPVVLHVCGQRGCNNNNNNNNGRKTAVKKQTNLHNMRQRDKAKSSRGRRSAKHFGVFTFRVEATAGVLEPERGTHAHTHAIGVKMLLGEVGPEKWIMIAKWKFGLVEAAANCCDHQKFQAGLIT